MEVTALFQFQFSDVLVFLRACLRQNQVRIFYNTLQCKHSLVRQYGWKNTIHLKEYQTAQQNKSLNHFG